MGTISGGEEGIPISMFAQVNCGPIIHSRPAQTFVVYLETIGLDQVKPATGVGAEPPDVTGVLGDFRSKKNQVDHRFW